MALFQFRPNNLKDLWIQSLGKEHLLSFDDWLLFNKGPDQNIILFYMGSNRPQYIRAEVVPGMSPASVPTSDIILFDLKSSTFDMFYELRNTLIYRPHDMWDMIEALALRRISADYHEF